MAEKDNKKQEKESKKEAQKGEQDQKPASDQEKIQELTVMLQRTQADFENYKKRMEKSMQDHTQYAAQSTITTLLPLIDNLDLAFKNKDNQEEFMQGMELIQQQLMQLLEHWKVEKIKTVGEAFDPHMHEALMQEASDQEKGTVLEEFQSGYALHGKVIRPAKVKVSKGQEKQEEKKQEEKSEESQEAQS
jgi:molecular chaperone GrpE